MTATLDDVLAYKHPAVVARFKRENPSAAHRSEELFDDLLRFFWSSKRHESERGIRKDDPSLDFVFIMDEEMRLIDSMWHVFLLYTQDYMDFCERYFGEYLHHLPDIVPTLKPSTFDPAVNLERFLVYIYDSLGEDVVKRWFAASVAEPVSA